MGSAMKENGPWRVKSARSAFANPWIEVMAYDVIRPDGGDGHYGVVRFRNLAVGVLPIDADGMTPLVGQHRFPHDAFSWELPEGGGPLEEDPLASAKRELREETGFTAANWLEFARFDVSNSVTDEKSVCFLAWNLTSGAPAPEPTEQFSYDRVSFSALHEMVLDGRISDSLTIVMVLKAAALARQRRLPAELTRLLELD
ncbi:MAG: NUDIX hydrolase [Pseudomonadota bacterium]